MSTGRIASLTIEDVVVDIGDVHVGWSGRVPIEWSVVVHWSDRQRDIRRRVAIEW